MDSRLPTILASRTLQEAADRLDLSKPRVAQILRDEGKPHHFRDLRKQRHAEWVLLMKAGKSDSEIARRDDVHQTAVRNVRLKHSIAPLPRGTRST